MRFQVLALLAAAVGPAIAQGVTNEIAPKGNAPEGCKPSGNGKFEITIVQLSNTAKRDFAVQKRGSCSGEGTLVAELANGVITDSHQRTGYIASNYQFQFDKPPQAGAIYTAGFSLCGNGSLALGSSTVFYQCRSGDFYNLYDRWWAAQCEPVHVIAIPCGGGGGGESAKQSESVVGSQVITTTVVAPLSDGQPQVITTTTVIQLCQIGDGQIQGHTTPCGAGAGAGAAATPTAAVSVPPVSQFSDGQIQVTPVPSGNEPQPSGNEPQPSQNNTSAPTVGGGSGEGNTVGTTTTGGAAAAQTSPPVTAGVSDIRGWIDGGLVCALGAGWLLWSW